jgi:hypothetical protein
MASVKSCSIFRLSQQINIDFNSIIDSISNLNKSKKELMLECVQKLMKIVDNQNTEISGLKDQLNHVLSTQLKQQQSVNKEIIDRLDKMGTNYGQKSFTDVVSYKPVHSLAKEFPKMDKNVIIVRPKNVDQKCKQTEMDFKQCARLHSKTSQIEEIKNISKGGIVVRCQSQQAVQDIKKMATDKCPALEVFEPKHKKPSIILRGVDSDISKESIVGHIEDGNREIKEYFETNPTEHIENHIKVRVVLQMGRHTSATQSTSQREDQQNKRNNFILEVSPAIRRILNRMRSMIIDLHSYRFSEHFSIVRCFKCQRFGHTAKNCREQKISCGQCCEEHDTKSCHKPKSEHKCINCIRHNSAKHVVKKVAVNHTVFNDQCPILTRMRETIKSRIIYD